MAQIQPYIFFEGNCQEAMNYYKSLLGGELSMMTVKESPVSREMPPDIQSSILHAMLKAGDIVIMASDMLTKDKVNHGNGVSLCYVCKSKDEVKELYDKFKVDSTVTMPLKDEFFGMIGGVIDKYGVNWMFEWGEESK